MRSAVKQVKDALSPAPHFASFTSDGQAYRLTYRRNLADTYLSTQTVFRADATASDGTTVDCVVKFASRYCDTAHRLMYEQGVAPRLLYCSFERTVGEYCVIMEYIQDTGRKISQDGARKLRKAVRVRHEDSFVFGDLRSANILIDAGGLPYLIDFDWCGKAGEVFYPPNITQGLIPWAEGVKGEEAIEAKHDDEMLVKYLKED